MLANKDLNVVNQHFSHDEKNAKAQSKQSKSPVTFRIKGDVSHASPSQPENKIVSPQKQ